MINSITNNDTICAMATPVGGAIALIRISGTQAFNIGDKIFKQKNNKTLTKSNPNTIHFGNIVAANGEIIDEVLVSVFHSPNSYTGEDSIEISCHGSSYIASSILRLLIENGCRQAKPGEYTLRSYLNGKIDLSQAEAVADLIASTNQANHRIAISQLKGHYSNELAQLRQKLLKITSLLELELDFSDHEDLEFAKRDEIKEIALNIGNKIEALCKSFKDGKAIKEGISVAIVGKTNVGKSTLLNYLIGEEKAIVSNIHGTTRDAIEDTNIINGLTFRFIDTAGIRETGDSIEKEGIKRTYDILNKVPIILWITDKNTLGTDEIEAINSLENQQKVIIVRNKIDCFKFTQIAKFNKKIYDIIDISAKNGININLLKECIYKAAEIPEIHENDYLVTSARHYDSLRQAQVALNRVYDSITKNVSADMISEELRQVIYHLSEITGNSINTEEVLENIFSHFCIGK